LFSVCGILHGQRQFDPIKFANYEWFPWSASNSTECFPLDVNQVADWKQCSGQCDHPTALEVIEMNEATGMNVSWPGACTEPSTTPVGISATTRVLEDKMLVPRALMYAAVVLAFLVILVPVLLLGRSLSRGLLYVFFTMQALQIFGSMVSTVYMLKFNSVDTHIDNSYSFQVSPMSMPFTFGPITKVVTTPNCALSGDGGPAKDYPLMSGGVVKTDGNFPNAWSWTCAKPLVGCNMTLWPQQSIPGCLPSCLDPRTAKDPNCLILPFGTIAPPGPTGSCDCAKFQLDHAPGVIDEFTQDMGAGSGLYLCIASILTALVATVLAFVSRDELFPAAEEEIQTAAGLSSLYEPLHGGEASTEVEEEERKSWWWVMPSVMLQSIALNCAISFIVPLKLKFYMDYYGGELEALENFPDVQSNLDTTTAILVFLTAGAVGELSDSFGRKPFFFAANVVNTIPIVCLWCYSAGYTDTLWTYNYFCVATGVLGATYAGNGILTAIIADTTTPAERMQAYGYLFAAFSVGFCVSPIVGAYIAVYLSNTQALAFSMVLCVINCLYTLFVFPETLPVSKRTPFAGFSAQYILDLIVRPVQFMCSNKLILCLASISFLGNFPENGVQENSLLFLQNQVGFMALDNAWVFFQTGFFCVIVQITLLLLIADMEKPVPGTTEKAENQEVLTPPKKSTKSGIIVLGLTAQLLHLLGYIWGPFLTHKTWFFPIETLSALSFIMSPAIQDVVSERLDSKHQGLGLGALAAVNGLASGMGPLVFGKIYSHVMTPSGPPVVEIDFSTMKAKNPCGARGLTSPLPAAITAYIIGAVCIIVAIALTLCVLPRLASAEEEDESAEAFLRTTDNDIEGAGVKTTK